MSAEVASKADFEKLEKKVDELVLELRLLNSKLPSPKVVTVKDICMIEGISKAKACIEKYYLPRFGESAYDGYTRWDIEEYEAWRKIPIEERRKQFQEYAFQKNQRASK